MGHGELSEVERQMLALEKLHFKYAGTKEQEIRARFDWAPTHYYQRLNVLIDTEAALAYDPMLVRRLRRLRTTRRRVAARPAGTAAEAHNPSDAADSSKEGHE
ncbi:hypothetical protein GCM10027591_18150 [Zhihengliuella somnathii]